MPGSEATSEAIAQANELYWSSELSVNQIAEQLDHSKGALYGMIQPLAAGLWCPDCGTKAVFANRTARERGHVTCPECGWEGSLDDAEGDGEPSTALSPADEVDVEHAPAVSVDHSRKRVLIGGALVGAAAGLALVFWARRR